MPINVETKAANGIYAKIAVEQQDSIPAMGPTISHVKITLQTLTQCAIGSSFLDGMGSVFTTTGPCWAKVTGVPGEVTFGKVGDSIESDLKGSNMYGTSQHYDCHLQVAVDGETVYTHGWEPRLNVGVADTWFDIEVPPRAVRKEPVTTTPTTGMPSSTDLPASSEPPTTTPSTVAPGATTDPLGFDMPKIVIGGETAVGTKEPQAQVGIIATLINRWKTFRSRFKLFG